MKEMGLKYSQGITDCFKCSEIECLMLLDKVVNSKLLIRVFGFVSNPCKLQNKWCEEI